MAYLGSVRGKGVVAETGDESVYRFVLALWVGILEKAATTAPGGVKRSDSTKAKRNRSKLIVAIKNGGTSNMIVSFGKREANPEL